MRIKELYYNDAISKVNINVSDFSDFTLLVGISGAGKTQILNAFERLKNIVDGDTENLEGLEWRVVVELNQKQYIWSGRFIKDRDARKYSRYFSANSSSNISLPRFSEEFLEIDGEVILARDAKETRYKNVKTPKISLHSSAISIFSEEKEIKPFFSGFQKVHSLNYENERRYLLPQSEISEIKNQKRFSDLNTLIKSQQPLIFKLAVLYNNFETEFKNIKRMFISIFPNVTDLKFAMDIDEDVYFLCLKEKNTGWIPQVNFSSGMYKTLMLISELHLLDKGSIILLDEIENSLGVNCIDEVVEYISTSNNDMQFIVTSHHPYIINNIDMHFWKIVTREGSKINVVDPSTIGIGNSKHDAFKQLMNSVEFRG